MILGHYGIASCNMSDQNVQQAPEEDNSDLTSHFYGGLYIYIKML